MEYDVPPKFVAFDGFVWGGFLGSIIDCHCNWTAAMAIMKFNDWDRPACTVTVEYKVNFKRPTPIGLISLTSRVLEVKKDRARTAVIIEADGKVCAEGEGFFF